ASAAARRELAASLAMVVRETDAVDTWQRMLTRGEPYRVDPIFTIELERLWLSDRPILFMGSIGDIETADAEHYRVSIAPSPLANHAFSTELRLSLKCTKDEVDTLLGAHPTMLSDQSLISNNLAVVARIRAIRTERLVATGGGTEDMRIGDGACVRLVYI